MTDIPRDGGALHYSADKSGVDQIPPEILMEWGDVFKYGEKKYERDNWKRGAKWNEFYGSALRHLFRWAAGEEIDPESGIPHLAHALWNVGALRYYERRSIGTDTRDVAPEVEITIEPVTAAHNEAFVLDGNGTPIDTVPIAGRALADFDVIIGPGQKYETLGDFLKNDASPNGKVLWVMPDAEG